MTLDERARRISLNVEALLDEARWTPRDLAYHSGLCRDTILRILGAKHTHTETQNKIATAFGLGENEPLSRAQVLRRHEPDQVRALYRQATHPLPRRLQWEEPKRPPLHIRLWRRLWDSRPRVAQPSRP